MTEEQKVYYIDNVCSVCNNNQNCDKDKFISTSIYDRISIKCSEYN